MGQRIGDSVNRWTNESVIQWISESVKQRSTESMNPWRRESKNQWIRYFLNPWINDQWLNEWTHGWMDGRTDGWVGYFSAELLLHWATSSLRYLLSQLLLIWAVSYLDSFCSWLPPSYLFLSFCNTILPFAQAEQGVLQPPVAMPQNTRVAIWSKTTFRAAVTMRLATSSSNPE